MASVNRIVHYTPEELETVRLMCSPPLPKVYQQHMSVCWFEFLSSVTDGHICCLHSYFGRYTGCVGGCDDTLRELLDLKDLTRLPSESGKCCFHTAISFCVENVISFLSIYSVSSS